MSNDLVALILDVVVLGFLGATIVYVMRLSKTLNDFKAHRKEFDGVITNLLASIDQAERSVQALKQISSKEVEELERLIGQSKLMSEELEIINEAGENMAKRLESLAERNRKAVQGSDGSMAASVSSKRKRKASGEKISSPVHKRKKKDYTSTLKSVEREADLPSFMIQDREFSDFDSLEDHLDSSASNDVYEDNSVPVPDDLQSQAERELFAALRTSKHNVSGKGRS